MRQLDLDPAAYSTQLMAAAEHTVNQALAEASQPDGQPRAYPSPLGVLEQAWKHVSEQRVAGSATACIAALDSHSEMLQAINIGDSGLYVFSAGQNIEKTGTMKSGLPRADRLHIVYRSRQQLHSFNRPFQLGWFERHLDKFDQPEDATVMNIPVSAGDLVILATDGLFDNMDEEVMLSLIHEWHARKDDRHRPASSEELARVLVEKAQELSMDKSVDSPFARLAKENDIMWSGGMPDDITVICMQVVQSAPTSLATP